jgi:hypothetical protein
MACNSGRCRIFNRPSLKDLHYFCAVSPGYNDFLDFIVNRERPLWNAILNGRFWPGAPIEHSAA